MISELPFLLQSIHIFKPQSHIFMQLWFLLHLLCNHLHSFSAVLLCSLNPLSLVMNRNILGVVYMDFLSLLVPIGTFKAPSAGSSLFCGGEKAVERLYSTQLFLGCKDSLT